MAKRFFIKDEINNHISNHLFQYYSSLAATFIAIVVGLILVFSDYSYLSILNTADKQIFDFIVGTADAVNLFYEKLRSVLLCASILFILNITLYTSFLSYIYIGYQMMLIVLSSASIISLYGFSGVLTVVFVIIPINLIYYLIIVVLNCVLSKRAYLASKYKLKFTESYKENDAYKYLLLCVLTLFILSFIYSFIMPLFIKNLTFIIY